MATITGGGIGFGFAFNENLITPRKHKQLMNKLLREEMERHRDLRLPKHFVLGANAKYNYQPISKRWAIHKAKKTGSVIPMVYTGRLREAMSTSRVTATDSRARMYGRGYFPMQDYFRGQIEIVLPSETTEMVTRIGKQYAALVNTRDWGRNRSRKKP